ncbi:hypothetical protein ACRALDRAFT_209038 [Sodiomyces alcalophilus JCM 7366]|uniref:uncharacterized protein n=1 Tax=Sodiomyces alcalophilus JCM 7366 TaxID=591952 RepID=UPI0039B438C0
MRPSVRLYADRGLRGPAAVEEALLLWKRSAVVVMEKEEDLTTIASFGWAYPNSEVEFAYFLLTTLFLIFPQRQTAHIYGASPDGPFIGHSDFASRYSITSATSIS